MEQRVASYGNCCERNNTHMQDLGCNKIVPKTSPLFNGLTSYATKSVF